MSEDQTVADDFRKLAHQHAMVSIIDRRLSNLSVRHGKSNLHHGAGSLIHLECVDLPAGWLTD